MTGSYTEKVELIVKNPREDDYKSYITQKIDLSRVKVLDLFQSEHKGKSSLHLYITRYYDGSSYKVEVSLELIGGKFLINSRENEDVYIEKDRMKIKVGHKKEYTMITNEISAEFSGSGEYNLVVKHNAKNREIEMAHNKNSYRVVYELETQGTFGDFEKTIVISREEPKEKIITD